jgi:putative sulfotransferase
MQTDREIAPVFVVGTGRCGSTMLSNMLRIHPDVLSLSEFMVAIADFGGRISQAFPTVPVKAQELWAILGGCHPRQTTMVRHGCEVDEMIYPLRPGSRFDRTSGVPAVMFATLPHLTEDPDALFEELRSFVMTLDPAPPVTQYERVFDWLRRRFRKRVWVERSGGSLRGVARLARAFPRARFIHMIRDGRDCAMSMSRQLAFRLHVVTTIQSAVLGCDPFECADRRGAWMLPGKLRRLLPEDFDAEALRTLRLPPALFGWHWSGEIRRGEAALAALSRERVLTVHFEDLLREPVRWLRRMIEFIDPSLVDEQWMRDAASLAGTPRSCWRNLPAAERVLLEWSCLPGRRALTKAGHDLRPDPTSVTAHEFAPRSVRSLG